MATARTRILIDAGLSRRETRRRLALLDEAADQLDGILVSHEHADHIVGLSLLSEEFRAPVYLTEDTLASLPGVEPPKRVELIRAGDQFTVGDIEVTPFSIPHDAADPIAFAFRAEGLKIALVTDLGYLPELVKEHVRECDCLIIESNHDLEMLKLGPYPWHIKQRVMSRLGHLSNHALAQFLSEEFDCRPRYLVLAHLSENNNHPEIARMAAVEGLERRAAPPCGGGLFAGQLLISSQREPLGPILL